jgi:hypothetical protein
MTGRRRKSGPPFVQLYRFVKRSQAWHELSVYGRCFIIEILDNNGMIGLGVREASEALKCSRSTALRAMCEVDDAGLARPTTVGAWRGKRATEWRLTFYRCDKTGDLPNKSWPTRSQFGTGTAKGSLGNRKTNLSSGREPQTPKNPMNENAVSSARGTHIESNHRVAETVGHLIGGTASTVA